MSPFILVLVSSIYARLSSEYVAFSSILGSFFEDFLIMGPNGLNPVAAEEEEEVIVKNRNVCVCVCAETPEQVLSSGVYPLVTLYLLQVKVKTERGRHSVKEVKR